MVCGRRKEAIRRYVDRLATADLFLFVLLSPLYCRVAVIEPSGCWAGTGWPRAIADAADKELGRLGEKRPAGGVSPQATQAGSRAIAESC